MIKNFFVAPLYNYTDRHCRYFHSLFTKYIQLYTGMIHTSLFLKNKKNIFFSNNIKNVKVAIQFIGNDCNSLYKSAKLVKKLNFSEINFNLGCPSTSSYFGNIGFFLMSNIKHVVKCVNSLSLGSSDNINISIKHRISDFNCYNSLLDFIGNISLFTKCKHFIIHARSIIKDNFSTKFNLKFPLLNYNFVYKLKKDFPHLNIVLNGNINNLLEAKNHLNYVNGIMIGRGIYFNPLFLFNIDNYLKNKKNYLVNDFDNFNNNNFFYKNNKISIKIRFIFFKLFLYTLKEINLNNVKPINIFRHVIYIFKNIRNASFLRKRLILASKNFKNFSCFYDFEKFLYAKYI